MVYRGVKSLHINFNINRSLKQKKCNDVTQRNSYDSAQFLGHYCNANHIIHNHVSIRSMYMVRNHQLKLCVVIAGGSSD